MFSLQNYLKSCVFAAVSLCAGQQASAQSSSPPDLLSQQMSREAFAIGFSTYPNDSVVQVMQQDLEQNLADYSVNILKRRRQIFPHAATQMETYVEAAQGKVHTIMRTMDKPDVLNETIYELGARNPYQMQNVTLFYKAPLNDSVSIKRESNYAYLPAYRQPGNNGSDYKLNSDVLTIKNKNNRQKYITRTCRTAANGKADPCRVTVYQPGSSPDTISVSKEITEHGIMVTKNPVGKAPVQEYRSTLDDYNEFVNDIKKVGSPVGYEQVKSFVEPLRKHYYENEFVKVTRAKPTYTPQLQPQAKPVAAPKVKPKPKYKSKPRAAKPRV